MDFQLTNFIGEFYMIFSLSVAVLPIFRYLGMVFNGILLWGAHVMDIQFDGCFGAAEAEFYKDSSGV
jgi:hypothetical protein